MGGIRCFVLVVRLTLVLFVVLPASVQAALLGQPLYGEFYYDLKSEVDNPPIDPQTKVIGPGNDFIFTLPDPVVLLGGQIVLDVDNTTIAMTLRAGCLPCALLGGIVFDGTLGGFLFNELRLRDLQDALPDFVGIQLVSTDANPLLEASRLHVSPDEIVFDFAGYFATPNDPLTRVIERHFLFEIAFAEAPEPTSLALLAIAFAGFAFRSRRATRLSLR